MARIAYADTTRPEAQRLVGRVIAERGNVLHIYRMLLHSPVFAASWLDLLSAIRLKSIVPGDLRELIIMRVAVLNGASYEADQHAPIALAEGVSPAQLDDLHDWLVSPLFNLRQRAVLALTDAMTRGVQVPDDVFTAVRSEFDDQTVVELVTTVSAYNMVSRFLEALQVHSSDHVAPPD